MKKVKIILASTREGRVGEKVANWVLSGAKKRKEFSVEMIDLKKWNLPFFDSAILPAMANGYFNPIVTKWAEEINSADGFIIVTPEYNHSFSAPLKNALDYLYKEWNGKPVAFVGYGYSANGGRVISHLRDVVAELQMLQTRNEVDIPLWTTMNEKGEFDGKNFDSRLEALFDQLASFLKMVEKK